MNAVAGLIHASTSAHRHGARGHAVPAGLIRAFERDGCVVVRDVVAHDQLVQVESFCNAIQSSRAGTRDSIPVKAEVASPRWSAWSVKKSVVFARPPQEVLRALVAVRVHLDDTGDCNGALHVIPGSHRTEVQGGERSSHFVPRGGALVMRPLLLHASSKVTSGSRRVLHFVYRPPALPDGAEWALAA